MNNILIVLQPTDGARSYPDFVDIIRKLEHSDDCFPSPFTCLMRTALSAEDVGKQILKLKRIDPRDRLIVLPLAASPWFAQNVDDCFKSWR
jgi:hypothetical protein